MTLLIMTAAMLTTGGCSKAFPESSSPAREPPPLVGAWRSQVHFKGGMLSDLHDLEFMYSFNVGGTLTQSSNYDGTPPAVPPAYGVWRQTGPRSFELKYTFYAPAKFIRAGRRSGWVPSGRGLYTETVELSPDSKSYTSHLMYEMVDPAGAPIPGGGEGEASGTRAGFDNSSN